MLFTVLATDAIDSRIPTQALRDFDFVHYNLHALNDIVTWVTIC